MSRTLLAPVCAAVLLARPAAAQFDSGAIVGGVRDGSGGAVAGASITLTNTATGVNATRSTDALGQFEFPAARIGTYLVTAEKEGFAVALADNVQVAVGARVARGPRAAGRPAHRESRGDRGAEPPRTESSQRGQVITGEQMRALPLNGRDYSSLALLTTGVRLSALNTGGFTPREGSFNVNGLRSTFNNFLIDGVDNNAYGTSNQGFSNQVMQPLARRGGRVQGRHQQHERGVRAVGRRDHQRRVRQRHQPLPRVGVGVHPRHQPQRHRLLQARIGREAAARAQPVRRRRRRAHS